MVANRCADFTRASNWICEIASSSNYDQCGPLATSASIYSGVQFRTTETGHPTSAYFSNKFRAWCCFALHLGNTRPHNFPSMATSGPDKNPRVTAVGHQPMPLLTCFPTNVVEHFPVLVLDDHLPPTRSTRSFLRFAPGRECTSDSCACSCRWAVQLNSIGLACFFNCTILLRISLLTLLMLQLFA